MAGATVAILGSSGFVGSAIRSQMMRDGWEVRPIESPRLFTAGTSAVGIVESLKKLDHVVRKMQEQLNGVEVIINAAGLAKPSGQNIEALFGANALLPLVVAEASRRVDLRRFIHISSASVQGNVAVLDESDHYGALSPYALSKAVGEQSLLLSLDPRVIILRPTSVHGKGRSLTRRLAKFARSPLSSVLDPGDDPTPQVLVTNVASLASLLCQNDVIPPPIVLQPWEGMTTSTFLEVISGRRPRRIPRGVGNSTLAATRLLSKALPITAFQRRLELLWLGQMQVRGWVDSIGFRAPDGPEAWEALARSI